MKKTLLFAALAAIFSLNLMADEALIQPSSAPAAPTLGEENVMALYCNHYATNNLAFNILGWGGVTTWETLTIEGTNILTCQDMKWEIMTNWDASSYDLSEYAKLHFDVWVPAAAKIKVTIEGLGVGDGGQGYKNGVVFNLNEGWNTIDADPAWWVWPAAEGEEVVAYDWTDARYFIFEGYQTPEEESYENNPFAFTNIYFWNEPAPEGIPEDGPEAPTKAESNIQALFSATYTDRTFNFAPTNWGSAWIEHTYDNGQNIWFTERFGWDAFTNWDADHYDLNAYDMMHLELYVTVDSKIKVTFEALGAGDGGSGWKNGGVIEGLRAGWNILDIDLLNAPYDSYDFKDLRYLILEGFQTAGGESAEGTPVAVANAYFWNSMTPVDNISIEKNAIKRIVDGKMIIEVNGAKYNAQGAQL